MKKHYFKNILWLAAKHVIREHIYSITQLLLSIIIAISLYLKLYYFVLPDVSPEIRIKLSSDVLSTTLNLMMVFGIILFVLISLIYNKNRTKTFGVLRGVGAKKLFVFMVMLIEDIILLLIATVLGLILALFFFNPTAHYLERMYSITASTDWADSLIAICLTLGISICLAFVTSMFTSLRLIFSDPYEIIRSRE